MPLKGDPMSQQENKMDIWKIRGTTVESKRQKTSLLRFVYLNKYIYIASKVIYMASSFLFLIITFEHQNFTATLIPFFAHSYKLSYIHSFLFPFSNLHLSSLCVCGGGGTQAVVTVSLQKLVRDEYDSYE